MKKSMKWSILLVSLAIAFVGVIWVTNRPVPPTNELKSNVQTISVSPMTGYRVPTFSLPSFPDNKSISLADYQGKTALNKHLGLVVSALSG